MQVEKALPLILHLLFFTSFSTRLAFVVVVVVRGLNGLNDCLQPRHHQRVLGKRSFFNHVNQILSIIAPLHTPVYFFFGDVRTNMHTIQISSTPYPPCFVNIVCERPLKGGQMRP